MASGQTIRINTTSPSVRGLLMLLPRVWMKELGIGSGWRSVAFGAKQEVVYVRELEGRYGQDCLQVSPTLAEALCLPQGVLLPLLKSGEGLRLGYVLGILANVRTQGGQVAGSQQQTFQHLLAAAADAGLYAYVFSPLDIKEDGVTALGYRYTGGKWLPTTVPLPDVVYDQIISRMFERRADVAPEREKLLQRLGARYFNSGFFHKWEVHQWLAENKATAKYMPDTIRYETAARAAEFLYRHSDAYLKPVHGSMGVGIMRLRRRTDGTVVYQLKRQGGKLQQGQLGSISVFLKKFSMRLRRGPYIIQEALRLMTWQGRPFDIRLLLQKDGTGAWNRTKTFCRIAQEGEITSNLSTGGDALAVKAVLKEILKDDKRVGAVMRELRRVADLVPPCIEEACGRPLGELGLDLGLDEDGQIWVIEVNAKPWKKPNTNEGAWRDLAALAFMRPMQYAAYLCKTAAEL